VKCYNWPIMEPKPKGFIVEERPTWIQSAMQAYRGPVRPNWTETDFCRADWSIRVLDKYVLPSLEEEPHILIAGLGLDMGFIPCSYSPFRIATHLEGKGLDYTMTLVDIDEAVILDVANRSAVSLWNPLYVQSGAEGYKDAWDKYLHDTNQADNMIGLTRVANVPRTFQAGLQTGGVDLLHADIATADLSQSQFDYAECLNVLYLLPSAGQQLAIVNMTDALKDGGYVLINDNDGSLFQEEGGWLGQAYLDNIGLQFVEEVYPNGLSTPTLFKKGKNK